MIFLAFQVPVTSFILSYLCTAVSVPVATTMDGAYGDCGKFLNARRMEW